MGADSLDIVELVMAFEEEFNVEIPDDAAEKIKAGASLVQIYSGLIYSGPAIVRDCVRKINKIT